MRLTGILLLAAMLQVSAHGRAQTVTYSAQAVPLTQVLSAIERQTGYNIFYDVGDLEDSRPVTVQLKAASLTEALEKVLEGQSLYFEIQGNTVSISRKRIVNALPVVAPPETLPPPGDIHGRVTDSLGNPLAGASVSVKGSHKGTQTGADGSFELKGIGEKAILVVSFTGYETQYITWDGKSGVAVRLRQDVNALQDVVINKGYYTEKQKLSTGDVGVVTAKEIQEQPVSDPLMALEGRVPGLVVTQINGVPGAQLTVQIRGQNSLVQGSSPLFVIDGVPYAPGNNAIQVLGSATGIGPGSVQPGGSSAFNNIDPAQIESIEVLKDADATAIYGSRGASGVILITTKKGKAGKLSFDGNVYQGASAVTHFMPIMNTRQYVEMRREAFANDGVTPTVTNAPDLLVYDTTRYTNLEKLFIGGTAHVTDAQTSLSGGNANSSFLVGAGYHHQTTVFPGDLADNRASVHLNFNQLSGDRKFIFNLSTSYSTEINRLNTGDITIYWNMPPDVPSFFDSLGNLQWQKGGVHYANPLAYLKNYYSGKTDNLLSNVLLSYQLLPGLKVRTSLGYNTLLLNETSLSPIAAQDPGYNPTGSSNYAVSQFKSWIIEPQVEYTREIARGSLNILAGSTWQEQTNGYSYISGSGYASDLLLQSIANATSVRAGNSNTEYHYTAVFGRVNYNWQDKYILNLTGRRDGSSRFGPGRQFGNFGAAGAAWIFSSEDFFRPLLSVISFGKLRGSYGTTGNDQIGDYKYLDSWTNSYNQYNSSASLMPSQLPNANYGWEINRKLEVASELGFFRDRLHFSVSWFHNRSSNQLINYALPAQTGASSVVENFPATVQNTGWEVVLTSRNIVRKDFSWTTTLNFSRPFTKLVAFPHLATSSYKNQYVVGEPLTVIKRYHSLGVDPTTGVFIFQTKTGPSSTPATTDEQQFNFLDPKLYGGIQNSLHYRGWQLDLFLQFNKQMGINYKSMYGRYVLGFTYNEPVEAFLHRWQKPGDHTDIQRFVTRTVASPGEIAGGVYFPFSDGIYSDASYIRLKNLSLSYTLPASLMKRSVIKNLRVYLQGQNLLTITHYLGNDPETKNFFSLPPLRTITAGLSFNL